MGNPVKRTILDLHILQTVPPSNLNRDDTGSPKSAVYGGVRRSRVSSQAWKRATRRAFEHLLDPSELGVRTRRVAEVLGDHIRDLDPSIPEAERWALVEEVVKCAIDKGFKLEVPKRKSRKEGDNEEPMAPGAEAPTSSYLVFFGQRQLRGLAELAVQGRADIKAFCKDRENRARARRIATTRHSVDIALFGRMVANATDINVDAAVQVAHALSVHAVEIESDYYTAVDDHNTQADSGAGMIGAVDFNSATLYRYAALDVNALHDNLGQGLDPAQSPHTPVRRAVEAFVHGFIASLPTGKVNTFGNHTLPDAVLIKLRTERPISYVRAFEEPVVAEGSSGHLRRACEKLAEHSDAVEAAYGKADGSWLLRVGQGTDALTGLGTEKNLADLVDAVGMAVADRLGMSA